MGRALETQTNENFSSIIHETVWLMYQLIALYFDSSTNNDLLLKFDFCPSH